MKADLLLKNGYYLDVIKREFVKGDIAIKSGKIIGINGDFQGEVKDISGKYVVPGFIDGHIHLESSIVSPETFARRTSSNGTTAVVVDPHEIANVCGMAGIEYMLQKTKNLPIDVFFMVSSCVPATQFDESAGTISSADVIKCFDELNKKYDNRILGLAEVMNYPGVIYGDEELLKKIDAAKSRNMCIDGHSPGLSGDDLIKYISAGIESDHECTSFSEAKEKLDVAKKLNVKFSVMIREGTAAKNLNALYPLINMNEYRDSVMFVTDDKHPEELKDQGHIDYIIKRAISLGVKPEDAYVTATYNAAKHFALAGYGKIEPDCFANLVILDDIKNVKINCIYKNGKTVDPSTDISPAENHVDTTLNERVMNSINMRKVTLEDIKNRQRYVQVIGLKKGEIITTDEGALTDYGVDKDVIKIVVIESHKGTMHTGIAYLKGMGLKKGAIGTTVAHDSHYMILAGTNDNDIVTAANRLIELQGGKIYVENGKIKAELRLEIAGLMTEEKEDEVINKLHLLKDLVKANVGIDPFMNLSFVSLAVIGDVRLLPSGSFDVKKWKFITEEELEEKATS